MWTSTRFAPRESTATCTTGHDVDTRTDGFNILIKIELELPQSIYSALDRNRINAWQDKTADIKENSKSQGMGQV